MKTTKTMAAIVFAVGVLVGATSSGQTVTRTLLGKQPRTYAAHLRQDGSAADQPLASSSTLPSSLPIGDSKTVWTYEVSQVQQVQLDLLSRKKGSTNLWTQYVIGSLDTSVPTPTNQAALEAYILAEKVDFVTNITFYAGASFQTNSDLEFDLDVNCAARPYPEQAIGLFETHQYFTLVVSNGVWQMPGWITNSFALARDASFFYDYLALPGLQSATARALFPNGQATNETAGYNGTLPQSIGDPRNTYILGSLYVDWVHHFMLLPTAFAEGSGKLVLDLNFGTQGTVKFDERGRVIAGREPIWLVGFSHYNGDANYPPADSFDIYYEVGATIIVERTADFAAWTPVQALNDAEAEPGHAVYSSSWDGYGLTASQKAALKTAPQSTGSGPSRSFYRARYQ